jgi:hypothetical protein
MPEIQAQIIFVFKDSNVCVMTGHDFAIHPEPLAETM